jgi:hypothetical protein
MNKYDDLPLMADQEQYVNIAIHRLFQQQDVLTYT